MYLITSIGEDSVVDTDVDEYGDDKIICDKGNFNNY